MVVKIGIEKQPEKLDKELPDYDTVVQPQPPSAPIKTSSSTSRCGRRALRCSIILNIILFICLIVALVFVFKGEFHDDDDDDFDGHDDWEDWFVDRPGRPHYGWDVKKFYCHHRHEIEDFSEEMCKHDG